MSEHTDEKRRSLGTALSQIEKRFGKGAVWQLGTRTQGPQGLEVISTGSLGLDLALGVGGVVRGRIVEVFGAEGCGKTTLALHIAAEAQKRGGLAAYIDVEHALDVAYARRIGVRTDDLLVSQPTSGEEALGIAEKLVATGAVQVLVIDSVAALVPKAELDGGMGASHPELQARLMGQALRRLASRVGRSKTSVIFINQLRTSISPSGGHDTTPGGLALKFFATHRLELCCLAAPRTQEEIGHRIRVRVVKNKVAPPFRAAEFTLVHGTGISRAEEVLDLALAEGVVERTGIYFNFRGELFASGRESALTRLRQHADSMADVESAVRAAYASKESQARLSA